MIDLDKLERECESSRLVDSSDMLKLIGRIRELETGLTEALDAWSDETCKNSLSVDVDYNRLRALVPGREGNPMIDERKQELQRLVAEMQRWEDEDLACDQCCMSCGADVHTPSGLEPAPLCNLCAQRWVAALPELLTRATALESDLRETTQTLETAQQHITALEVICELHVKARAALRATIDSIVAIVAKLDGVGL